METGKESNMPNMQTDEFLRRFQGILKDTWKLVQKKNEQYSTNDALANFTTGAKLQYHDGSPEWQFETLKDYMLKHVAHVYNNRLMGNGVRESLGDIATYCIIGMIMHDAIDTRLPEPKSQDKAEENSGEAEAKGLTIFIPDEMLLMMGHTAYIALCTAAYNRYVDEFNARQKREAEKKD